MKQITLIKLGGGLIAPKNWDEETADAESIRRLVQEITDSGKKVLIVTGSGNFGHKAAKKYGIDTAGGVEKVRRSAKKIGEIVQQKMQDAGIETKLVEPYLFFAGEAKPDLDRTLVFYGDVIELPGGGWTIFSGEKIIGLLVPMILEQGWKISRIVQVSVEEGVWDSEEKIIPEINPNNWQKLKQSVGGAKAIDMTGGMLHKVEESLKIAGKYRIETIVIGGKTPGRLLAALRGEKIIGTVIK